MGCVKQSKRSKKSNEDVSQPSVVQGNDVVENKAGNIDENEIARKTDGVQCTLCSKWLKAGQAGVDGISFKDIGKIEVYCQMCVYNGMTGMKTEMEAYEKRISQLEGTIETLYALLRENGSIQSHQKTVNRSVVHNTGDTHTSVTSTYAGVMQSQGLPKEKEVRLSAEERSRETTATLEEELDQSKHVDDGADDFQVIQRNKRSKSSRKKKINIIGDSIARGITRVVKCNEQGSGCTSIRGAGIKQIMLTCEKKAEELEDDSLLIIEGGGNSLKYLGEEETVTCMMESIKRIKEKKLMKVAVLGIIPRPQEKAHYERQKRGTNRRLQQELCSLK